MHSLGRGARRFDRATVMGRCLLGLLACLLAQTSSPVRAAGACDEAEGDCVDPAIRDELNARRQYRGVQERVFQKALRHELSAYGGGYAADLTSSSYLVGGAYTFHLSEDLGLEANFGYTRSHSELVRIVEDKLGTTLVKQDTPVFLYTGHLLWTLAYGKLRWFHSSISRFDFYLALGGGVTDNRAARGLTLSGGLGFKFYPTRWFAVRIDVRDQLLNQELLGESRIVNNVLVSAGLSVFIPFGF